MRYEPSVLGNFNFIESVFCKLSSESTSFFIIDSSPEFNLNLQLSDHHSIFPFEYSCLAPSIKYSSPLIVNKKLASPWAFVLCLK